MIRVITDDTVHEFDGIRDTASGKGVELQEFLLAFALAQVPWEIDLSGATSEECVVWARVDMGARIFRALFRGTPVSVLGQTFRGLSQLSRINEKLANIRCSFCVESDTPEELRIGVIKN